MLLITSFSSVAVVMYYYYVVGNRMARQWVNYSKLNSSEVTEVFFFAHEKEKKAKRKTAFLLKSVCTQFHGTLPKKESPRHMTQHIMKN